MSKRKKETKTKTKAETKDKKPSIKLRRVWENNLFMLKLIHKASPGFLALDVSIEMLWAAMEFFSGSYLLKVVVDSLKDSGRTGWLYLFVAVLFVLHLALQFLVSWFWNCVGWPMEVRLTLKIRKLLYARMRSVELSCYEDPAFYEKYVKAMSEVNNRAFQVMWSLERMLTQVFSLTANVALLWTIDPVLIIFGLIPFAVGFLRTRRNKLSVAESNDMKRVDWHTNYVQRCFYLNEYAKEMRLTHMPDKMLDDYQGTLDDFIRIKKRYGKKISVLDYIIKMSHEVATVLGATFYTVYATLVRGTITAGDCLVVINSIGSVSMFLSGLVSNIASFHEHALFIDNLRSFLDYQPKIRDNPEGLTAGAGRIAVSHLAYRYQGAEKDALSDVSLTVAPGEKIALVGQNGSGKTTFVKLLLHMYQPSGGEITLDGHPMEDYTLSSWRADFEPVFQDFKLLGMSVAENILRRPMSGEGEAQVQDRATVTEALRQSGALERVERMPHGMDTVLTKEFDSHGEVLSGGEAQKVALARVFAGTAPFVILDEPTSALDPVAEYTLFENMMRACADRAVIFISHRLSSAVLADRVYLFDGGRVVESGSHAELMERNGQYADMFRRQAESYVERTASEAAGGPERRDVAYEA